MFVLKEHVNCTCIYSFRFALSTMDMGLKDYDSRTALHIAAAEGELHVVCLSAVLIFISMTTSKNKHYSIKTLTALKGQISH